MRPDGPGKGDQSTALTRPDLLIALMTTTRLPANGRRTNRPLGQPPETITRPGRAALSSATSRPGPHGTRFKESRQRPRS